MKLEEFESLVRQHLENWSDEMVRRMDADPRRYKGGALQFEQSFPEWWSCFDQADPSELVRNAVCSGQRRS